MNATRFAMALLVLTGLSGTAARAQQTQACCLENGDCINTTPTECDHRGGRLMGQGTQCTAGLCPAPQACCLQDGGCTVIQLDTCYVQGGTPQGVGTTCYTDVCHLPACCLPDGRCVELGPDLCNAYHGVSVSGICDPNNNPCLPDPSNEACCLPGDQCENLLPTVCVQNGGVPQGLNSTCDQASCPDAVASASSTFDYGQEDWTEHEGLSIWWEQTGGHPDGFLESYDTSGWGAGDARASAAFLGDWSGLSGTGAVRWDMRCIDRDSAPIDGHPIVTLRGPGGWATHVSPCLITTAWRTFEVPLNETLWTVSGGTWPNVLAEVQEVLFAMDMTTGKDRNGLDNVVVYSRATDDCNGNGVPDTIDLLGGASLDCNCNYIPDECDVNPADPDGNGLVSADSNSNGIPDECELVPRRGDMNCDGRVNYSDINPFVLALTSRAAYEARYPGCLWTNADINGDASVNYADINPFVRLLAGP